MDQVMKSMEEWVRFCPHCGTSLTDPHNLLNEYASADISVFFWWCHTCGSKGEITSVERVTAPELVEGGEGHER